MGSTPGSMKIPISGGKVAFGDQVFEHHRDAHVRAGRPAAIEEES